MREAERLRDALKSEHHDFVSFVTDPTIFGDDDEMWNEHRRANPDCPVCTLLSSKPDVCVYTRELFENEVRLTSACGRVWTWEDVDAGMAIPDKIHQYCSKCGAKIEVRE